MHESGVTMEQPLFDSFWVAIVEQDHRLSQKLQIERSIAMDSSRLQQQLLPSRIEA